MGERSVIQIKNEATGTTEQIYEHSLTPTAHLALILEWIEQGGPKSGASLVETCNTAHGLNLELWDRVVEDKKLPSYCGLLNKVELVFHRDETVSVRIYRRVPAEYGREKLELKHQASSLAGIYRLAGSLHRERATWHRKLIADGRNYPGVDPDGYESTADEFDAKAAELSLV